MGLTYNGTTAGSTSANPPVVLDSVIGGQFPNGTGLTGGKVWLYSSTNDVVDFVALNSINDGGALGMKGGDIMFLVSASAASTAPKLQMGVIVTSAAATGFSLSSNVLSSTAV